MNQHIINNIIKNNLCIGCGICVGMCPQKALKIEDNIYGEYNPSKIRDCSPQCTLCLKVCPFSSNENETELGTEIYGDFEGIKFLSEIGYYLESYVGYSNEFRQIGASGGITTWILTKLLREKIVDYVICPQSVNNPDKLFDFKIFNEERSLKNTSGSVYYPVEMSEIISNILKTPGRYAITGLPCFLKALRLATKNNNKLRTRIVVTIGLTCGQLKNKHYTAYLCKLSNVDGKIETVHYRGKSPEKPSNNYYFSCANEKGKEGRVFLDEGVAEAWMNKWFTLNACNFCDDIFAELADIAVMDAWLPEYFHESKGTNLIIVRSPLLRKIISEGKMSKEVNVDRIEIEKIIQSQSGLINVKRKQLPYRLYLAQKNGQEVPHKRFEPNKNLEFFEKKRIKIENNMQQLSKDIFISYNTNYQFDIENFRKKMNTNIKIIKLLKILQYVKNKINLMN